MIVRPLQFNVFLYLLPLNIYRKTIYFGLGLGWVVHFRNTVSELACHPYLRPQKSMEASHHFGQNDQFF